jgi:hypothetical protein
MKTIGILANKKSSGLLRLLDALSKVMGVRFEERVFGDDAGIDAWILLESDLRVLHTVTHFNCPCYIVIRKDQLAPCGESSTINFFKHHVLPIVISGRQINIDEATEINALPQWVKNTTPIAFKEGAPIWAMQEERVYKHNIVSLPIPELGESESLFDKFNGHQFLQLLPLLLFLRTLTEDPRWETPPIQACFMFDDPNIHWRTYGYINYEEMVRHAQRHDYHASIATIPLDAWFTHIPTASLFKLHSDRLSLLIHGNDHVFEELTRACSDKECDGILRQSLRRINELERRSGVEISKVMVAPHGAFSEQFLQRMGQVGFEAACVSSGSLRHYNRQASWVGTIGMRPSDVIAGLPVFPRFRLSSTCQNSILVAAVLQQPIIPVGHHHDIADGLQLLANLSEFINSLGSVCWSDMKGISRSHFARKFYGRILQIRMFTKRVEVCIPEGIEQVSVERLWPDGSECEPLTWRIMGNKMEWSLLHPDESIPVLSGQKLEIALLPPPSLCEIDIKYFKKPQLWPIVRRQLTEARDRVSPFLKKSHHRN